MYLSYLVIFLFCNQRSKSQMFSLLPGLCSITRHDLFCVPFFRPIKFGGVSFFLGLSLVCQLQRETFAAMFSSTRCEDQRVTMGLYFQVGYGESVALLCHISFVHSSRQYMRLDGAFCDLT